jgi:aryl-alcohol dehydrogenase-like predicted oxidoreductase
MSLAELALRFVLEQDGVDVAIPGAKTPAQVEGNVRAADGRLGPVRLDAIREAA